MTRLHLDPDSADVNAYKLMTSLVVPRPIAWVASRSAAGVGNLAPHSFFTVVCADPPIVAFASIGDKDTLRNVLETREFTISVATEALMDEVNATGAHFDADTDEAAALGIEMRPSTVVGPPAVAGSPGAMECTLHSTVDFGSSTLVLGTVVSFSVDEDVMEDGLPAYDRMGPVARLGREEWGLPSPTVSVARPARPQDIDPQVGSRTETGLSER
ncbi:flavin reductase family protein [Nocardioides sp.]|uniref:flavin reductase family protein n=1 Tax=Nocardioides sp. TaxID=35761 RepID=UPI00286BD686|nr:flavin reductase family protein [Nocardioides sp.]